MQRFIVIPLMLTLLLGASLSPLTAQEPPTSVITAEVIYPEVNLRVGASQRYNSLALLPQGTIVEARAWDDYATDDLADIWVLVTVPDSGLEGWIRADLVRFSDADWMRNLARLNKQGVREATFELIETPYQTQLTGPNRSMVYQDAAATIPLDYLLGYTEVVVLGQSPTICGYVYIRQVDGELEGWVSAGRLMSVVRAGISCSTSLSLIIEPQPIRGQMLAWATWSFNLRLLPDPNSNIVALISYERLVVHGRTSQEDTAWVYVTLPRTGQSGWVIDMPHFWRRSIGYPYGFDFTTLPILPTVANPSLLPDAATLGSLAVTVPQTASLQITAWDSLELASGSSVTLLGRNFEGTSFWADYNGQKGWLEVEELTFQREFNYLPIID
jgi:hypothetical protein